MSNATQHSRQSGDQKRRRSRGGKSRSRGRSGGSHDSRDSRQSSHQRSEEFRPTGPRPPRNAVPPKPLTWWQKLLQTVGLYKVPEPQLRPSVAKPAQAPVKSNTRIARSAETKSPPQDGGSPPKRERRSDNRPRGGDRNSVESARVYVGNLSYDVTEQDIQELFKGVGSVRGVEIVYNRSTHRSKGYGFVEMLHKDEAMRAVEILHDQHFMGRKLTVSGAKSKGQDEREDGGENEEQDRRESRPVVVAPVTGTESNAADDSEEPQIATVIESVTETPADETAETPADNTAETPVASAETPADDTAETPVASAETPADDTAQAPADDTEEAPASEPEDRPGAV